MVHSKQLNFCAKWFISIFFDSWHVYILCIVWFLIECCFYFSPAGREDQPGGVEVSGALTGSVYMMLLFTSSHMAEQA